MAASVSVEPILQATITTPNNAALPSTIGIQLTWNGVAQGSPITGLVRNRYDAAGRDTSLVDPVANKSTFQDEARGQLTHDTDPHGETIARAYDDQGRVSSITDRLGRVREFTYFNNDKVSTEVWRATAGGTIVNTLSYTYNENGQILTAAWGKVTQEAYYALGRKAFRARRADLAW